MLSSQRISGLTEHDAGFNAPCRSTHTLSGASGAELLHEWERNMAKMQRSRGNPEPSLSSPKSAR